MATNNEYKIISSKGKGLATGDAAAANEARLTSDADFRASELERTNQVIADRKAAGADVSQQEAYLGRINQLNAAQPAQEVDPYAQLRDLIIQESQTQTKAFTEVQNAALDVQRQNIEGTYADAVAEQERLKTQAGENYEGRLEQIDESRYRETERGRIVGEQRGIGSSAQFQALQQGVVSRAGQQKLDAATNRDRILTDLSQRIAQLGLQKGRDLATAEAQTRANIAQGTANIASTAFGQQLGLETDALKRQQQLEDTASAREYQTSEREASELFSSMEAALGRKFTAEENALNRDFQAFMQERGFDQQLTMFDKNADLQKTMAAIQNQYAIDADDRRFNNQKALAEWNRAEELKTELNKYTEGTPEYEAFMGAVNFEREELANRAEQDFEWAKKMAEFEVELAEAEYERNLQRQLNAFEPGTTEYAIQQRALEAGRAQRFEDMKFELTNQITADAMMSAFTAPGEEPSGWDRWNSNVKQAWTEISNIEALSGKSDQEVVDDAVRAGVLIGSQEQIDAKAVLDRMLEQGVLDNWTHQQAVSQLSTETFRIDD